MVFSDDDNFKQYGVCITLCFYNLVHNLLTDELPLSSLRSVFDRTQSGSCLANECNFQAVVHGLPFGGVGMSGCEFPSDGLHYF